MAGWLSEMRTVAATLSPPSTSVSREDKRSLLLSLVFSYISSLVLLPRCAFAIMSRAWDPSFISLELSLTLPGSIGTSRRWGVTARWGPLERSSRMEWRGAPSSTLSTRRRALRPTSSIRKATRVMRSALRRRWASRCGGSTLRVVSPFFRT